MEKASLSRSNNEISITMGFSKVDRENRRVRGYATFDNVDKQGDIVLASASERAFREFAGNIREMHDAKKAVGRLVQFESTKIVDPQTGKPVNGILVDVYVSKGAPDTWEKVLDRTLAGFSIGGTIKAAEEVYDSESGNPVRVIKEYSLNELSLVDNPANQLANVVSIIKVDEGGQVDVADNMVSTTASTYFPDNIIYKDGNGVNSNQFRLNWDFSKSEVENVLYCSKDDVTILSKSEGSDCPVCSEKMRNIGWVQRGTGEAEVIKGLLAKIRGENLNKNGGNEDMADAVEETIDTTVEKSDEAEVNEAVVNDTADAPAEEVEKSEAAEGTSEDNVEKSEPENSEVVDTTPDLIKAIDDLRTIVDGLAASLKEVTESVTKGLTEVTSKVSEVAGSTEEAIKRLDAVEDATAVKKSVEVGPSTDGEIQKSQDEQSFWAGRFVSRTYFN